METLYDLLGALPRDDAEDLRTAFRRAVKGAHPDLRPGDPNAALKFREIVRAHDILRDGEQRAAYDHLLELARIEASEDVEHAVKHARAGQVHRLASWVMAVVGVSAVSIAGFVLVVLLWTSTEPAADARVAGLTRSEPAPTEVATVPEPPPALAVPAVTAQPLAPPLDITPPPGAATERTQGFNHAYADISHAKRPDAANHVANAKKKGAPAATEIIPLPHPRRTAANDLSRQEGFPFNPRP